ncbi:MAG: DUF86 domain-containing protein [Oscillatoriales cyanobacterium RU_3_3]|nr:DUF86 domain-containing protein [Microcoleus sp. SU_5_6]NJL66263.1 DUF86 domain-containing protein [Microcoleus sp. SM1_3_4]NJM61148.1 DUF86 domain-containing protein [Oscillatoriales cyanobacterium RU_3_3]NJR24622.1 DUF86 domain-containing protein [Richelia sp. CSU_2_1]
MSIEKSVVLKRLQFIANNLKELRRFESMSLENYLESFDQKLISERIMELIAQAAADINEHILTRDFNVVIDSNRESFVQAGQHGIITTDVADELSKSAGLRNILAHRYLEINYPSLFNSVQIALRYYPLYIQQIAEYLARNI